MYHCMFRETFVEILTLRTALIIRVYNLPMRYGIVYPGY